MFKGNGNLTFDPYILYNCQRLASYGVHCHASSHSSAVELYDGAVVAAVPNTGRQ